jgi:inorganic triphosphatase YgiF
MCVRVLAWLTAHPDDEPGMAVLLAQLQALVTRMTRVIGDQREGRIEASAASARRLELEREMQAGPIAHLARIGSLASREVHELRSLFAFRPAAQTHLAFQEAVRSMVAAADAHQEVLVKYGLSPSALEQFRTSHAELGAVMELAAQGRVRQTAATRELEGLTKDATSMVKAIDSRVRLRFRDDRPALAEWISARTVLGNPVARKEDGDQAAGGPTGSSAGSGGQPDSTPTGGGNVRPAA